MRLCGVVGCAVSFCGLFYDRLIGNGVRGTAVDAAAVLKAWLTGVGT